MPLLPPVMSLAPISQLVSTPAKAKVASEKVISRKRSVKMPTQKPPHAAARAPAMTAAAIGSPNTLAVEAAT